MSRWGGRVSVVVLALVLALVGWFGSQQAQAQSRPPALKIAKFGVAAAANTDLQSSDIVPSRQTVAYDVTVGVITTSSVFNYTVTDENGTTETWSFNNGSALTAGATYTFSFGAYTEWTYNFQCATATTCTLLVEEIQDGGR